MIQTLLWFKRTHATCHHSVQSVSRPDRLGIITISPHPNSPHSYEHCPTVQPEPGPVLHCTVLYCTVHTGTVPHRHHTQCSSSPRGWRPRDGQLTDKHKTDGQSLTHRYRTQDGTSGGLNHGFLIKKELHPFLLLRTLILRFMNDLLLHRIDLIFSVWVVTHLLMLCDRGSWYVTHQLYILSRQSVDQWSGTRKVLLYHTYLYWKHCVLNFSSRLLTFQHFRQYPNEASYCRCDWCGGGCSSRWWWQWWQ